MGLFLAVVRTDPAEWTTVACYCWGQYYTTRSLPAPAGGSDLDLDLTARRALHLETACKHYGRSVTLVRLRLDFRKNMKDGYRQQNVRQRQKLISIIDYDVCMTFY